VRKQNASRIGLTLVLGAVATIVCFAQVVVPDKKHPNLATEQKLDAFWRHAQKEVYRSPEELVAQRDRELRRDDPAPLISRGDGRSKVLALTFDDGPHPGYTMRLLAILKKERIPATFFVIGKMAEQHPELIQAIAADGHEIGNHTFSHVTLTKIPVVDVRTEYRACNDLISSITGHPVRYCRPPGGDYDDPVVRAALEEGLTTVLWTDDPGDYLSPGTLAIERKTLQRIGPGGIILLHDGIEETLDILPQIIEWAKAHGYRFTTIANLPLPKARASLSRHKSAKA